jgi:hypothetical protein
LAAGASVDIRDNRFDGTALGWALHAWSSGGPAREPRRYADVARELVAAGARLDREWREPSGSASGLDARPGAAEMREALGLP